MRRCASVVFAALPLAIALGAGPALAAVYQVNPDPELGDFPTIQAAFDSELVQDGDEIVLADGVFSGPGNRNLDPGEKELVIRSASDVPQRCILDGGNVERVFWLHGGQTSATVIRGITIRRGRGEGDCPFCSGGGVLCADSLQIFEGASPLIANCIFRDCEAEETGGALFSSSFSAPILRDCRFIGNHAHEGGALCFNTGYAGTPQLVEDCFFDDNAARRGGALFVAHGGPAGAHPVVLTGCVFRHNEASLLSRDKPAAGGAIYLWGATATVDGCTLEGNSASQHAGGIYLDHGARAQIHRTIVSSSAGAAVACEATSAVEAMSCCDLHLNSGGDWVGCAFDFRPEVEPSNLSADPAYCDAAAADYFLEPGSPCLPGASCTEGIGAHPATCDFAAVDERAPGAGAWAHPAEAPRLAAWPSPFLRATWIRCAATLGSAARLTIHDPAGRLLRTLIDGRALPAGGGVAWDGRDDEGRLVASGAYLARLTVGEASATARLVRLE